MVLVCVLLRYEEWHNTVVVCLRFPLYVCCTYLSASDVLRRLDSMVFIQYKDATHAYTTITPMLCGKA